MRSQVVTGSSTSSKTQTVEVIRFLRQMTWMTAGLLSVRCTLDFELKIRKLQKCAKLIIKGGLVKRFLGSSEILEGVTLIIKRQLVDTQYYRASVKVFVAPKLLWFMVVCLLVKLLS